MTFGRRTTRPTPGPIARIVPAPSSRKGGYPLAVLATALAVPMGAVVLSFIPSVNPTGMSLVEVLPATVMATLNVVAIAALVLLLIDLGLRALKIRGPAAYGLACGLGLGLVCTGLMSLLTGPPIVALVLAAAVWPGVAGGAVLGWFRR